MGNKKEVEKLVEQQIFERLKKLIHKDLEEFLSEILNGNEKEIQQLIAEASQCEIKKQNRLFIWLLFLNIIPYNKPKEWNNIIYDLRSDFLNSRNSYFNEDITNFIKTQATKGSEEYETLKVQVDKLIELVGDTPVAAQIGAALNRQEVN